MVRLALTRANAHMVNSQACILIPPHAQCVITDLNRGTPTRTDFKSVVVDPLTNHALIHICLKSIYLLGNNITL